MPRRKGVLDLDGSSPPSSNSRAIHPSCIPRACPAVVARCNTPRRKGVLDLGSSSPPAPAGGVDGPAPPSGASSHAPPLPLSSSQLCNPNRRL